ncbi:type I restriction endonuclease subunit R [Neorhizobium galegae]|uniref:type I restriction endonuclease subunit R n=1 Tax=Neorhizobium galegae TaxID=399 RepID=UPI0006222B6C|nr:type I restriction endonuclease [Neorhizobium galegae]CDZ54493.1 Type I site-specific deoxyribonuclease, HsdR family [Neorhizobium galegae bv. orientalis]
MTQQDRLDELNVVERPLLHQLAVMGWSHVEGAEEDPSTGRKDYHLLGRADFQQTLLRDRLEDALRRLNYNDDGSEWLDDRRIHQAISQLERPTARDFIAINEELHEKIVRGVNVSGPDGEHERRVRFIGFEEGDPNEFIAVNQYRVDPPGAVGDRGFIIPDIVLFVNGLPLVVIEAKSPAVTDPIATAIDQMRRYANRRIPEKNEGAERLFWTNHLLVATDYYDSRVGSVTARPDDFLPWRSVKPVGVEHTRATSDEVCREIGKAPGTELMQQEVLAAGLLRPAYLLDALRSFTVFMTTDDGVRIKVVPRYQQFRSVHIALQRLREGKTRRQDGMTDRRGGIIWHTQGSGKSLTMVFLVKKLRTIPELRRFKVVVVTDRTDLEDQLSKTAKLAGQVMRVAPDADGAKTHLSRQEPDLVFVMIQKLRERNGGGDEQEIVFAAENEDLPSRKTGELRSGKLVVKIGERPTFPVLNESEDVLVLIDEAHRSHTSGLHQNLLDALPNAARIGFTGTPIEEKSKKKTREIFGTYIDRYLLRDAEADGAIVKILYEGRELKADVTDKGTLDGLFDTAFAGKSPEEREAIKDRYATRARVLNAADALKAKAIDVLRHYIVNILPNDLKAQLVASSRELAVQYVDALNGARDEIVAAIEGAADILKDIALEDAQNAGGDVAFLATALPYLDAIKALEFAAVISVDHNDLPHLKAWGGMAETKQRIERFKKPLSQDALAILVVKSKLLTGFDAKVEQAMYLDRAISGAELLQAIARTNRTAGEAKRFGIVVDYYGVGKNLADALAIYDAEDQSDLAGGIGSPDELLPELRQARDAVVKHFADVGTVRGSSLQAYVDACVGKLKDQKFRAEFLVLVKRLVGLFDTLMPRPEAGPFTIDVKIYAFIAKAAANLYRDGSLDVRGVAHKVQAMLDAFIQAHGIDPKIPPIEILDPDFAAEVSRKKTDRAKAAEMENALRHHISISFEKDPAKFKSLSERLEGILTSHQEDWNEIAKQLQKLIDEALAASPASSVYHGLAPHSEGPIFGILRMRYGSDDRDSELAELAAQIVRHLRQETAVAGFWDNSVGQEEARRWIFRQLDSSNLFPFVELDAIAADCMGVARANRAAFVS